MDHVTAWIASIWTALVLFVTGNIEPMPGVIVAACGGSLLSAFLGKDTRFSRIALMFVLGATVGIFASQVLAEILNLKFPQLRGSFAFFFAMFSEKMISAISGAAPGDLLDRILDRIFGARK